MRICLYVALAIVSLCACGNSNGSEEADQDQKIRTVVESFVGLFVGFLEMDGVVVSVEDKSSFASATLATVKYHESKNPDDLSEARRNAAILDQPYLKAVVLVDIAKETCMESDKSAAKDAIKAVSSIGHRSELSKIIEHCT